VAVVPDAYLNPAAGSDDHLVGLAAAGWGVVALPQPGLPAHVERAALAAVADQLTAFLDDGYEVALAEPDDPLAGRLNGVLVAGGRRLRAGVSPLTGPGSQAQPGRSTVGGSEHVGG
jgi:hypothetical protein